MAAHDPSLTVRGAVVPADLVDRLYWIQGPLFLRDAGVPAIAGLPGSSLASAPRWTVIERIALGADTVLVLDKP